MEPRFIQSCVTSIGFPDTLEDLELMFEKNEELAPGGQLTDLELVLGFNDLNLDFIEWTAARWMTEGDVLYFYHTNRGHKKIRRLLRELRKGGSSRQRSSSDTIETLERNLQLSTRVESCIFACAPVRGSAMYYAKQDSEHFMSRSFVPFGQVSVFDKPLHSSDFALHFKIGQNTVTPLYKRNFGAINELLERDNEIPDYLACARISELAFQDISKENWRQVVASPQARFLNEELVREYFIDYLLDEIRDPRTPILEECVTSRNGQTTGRADYFVMVNGRWIPIEAKLNILTESDLLGQIGKYLRIDKFVPTVRKRRGSEFFPEQHDACVVIDQSGIYLTHAQSFINCDFAKPWLPRELVIEDFPHRLRGAIIELIDR